MSCDGSPERPEYAQVNFYTDQMKFNIFPMESHFGQMKFYTYPMKSHMGPEKFSCYLIRVDPDLLSVNIDQEKFYTDPVKFDIDPVR